MNDNKSHRIEDQLTARFVLGLDTSGNIPLKDVIGKFVSKLLLTGGQEHLMFLLIQALYIHLNSRRTLAKKPPRKEAWARLYFDYGREVIYKTELDERKRTLLKKWGTKKGVHSMIMEMYDVLLKVAIEDSIPFQEGVFGKENEVGQASPFVPEPDFDLN